MCVIQKSLVRCSACIRKNIRCDGVFSEAEFEALKSKKTELKRQWLEARSCLTRLAYELLAAEKDVDKLDWKLEKVYDRQEEMVALEARALEELDGITSHRDDLVIPEPPKVAIIPGDLVALMSDVEFSWDDLEILAMMQDSGSISGQDLG